MKINSISANQAKFPANLHNIPDRPERLYYIGQLPEQGRAAVAIVGSRKPTAYGRMVTEQIASGLARRGVMIISGLAFGVDAIAHRATLEVNGTTLAVLPEDLNHIYPRSHQRLATDIVRGGGGLISEHHDKQYSGRWDFSPRNRIVSGLADAVIVTEANVRSGTMSTVAHALAQAKDVYAVPGPITSPLSGGCNRLIAQGATPIYDVEEFIGDFCGGPAEQSRLGLAFDEDQTVIVNLIKAGLSDGDVLLAKTGWSITKFNQTMTMLELQGSIHALGGNQWRL